MPQKSKSQRFYDRNPSSRAKKQSYDKKFNARPDQVKKRTELNKENRKRGTYANGDKKDLSHTKNGLRYKPQSVNRGSKSDQPGDVRSRGKRARR
jgi:hypothetical protein